MIHSSRVMDGEATAAKQRNRLRIALLNERWKKNKQRHQTEDLNLLACCGIHTKQQLSSINKVPAKEHFHASSSCNKKVSFVRFLPCSQTPFSHLNANPVFFAYMWTVFRDAQLSSLRRCHAVLDLKFFFFFRNNRTLSSKALSLSGAERLGFV